MTERTLQQKVFKSLTKDTLFLEYLAKQTRVIRLEVGTTSGDVWGRSDPMGIEMTVEGPVSDDNDGPPHIVSDSESESTQGIRFYIFIFLYSYFTFVETKHVIYQQEIFLLSMSERY